MADYKRPGVYIEEIPLFPPSVAGVSTAVPAFIGYTEFDKSGGKSGEDNIKNKPIRITSLLEFTTIFGGPPPLNYVVNTTGIEPDISNFDTNGRKFILYYAVKMFFQYGESPCYIVSMGKYYGTSNYISYDPQNFKDALDVLEKEDEPTLIVIPESIYLVKNNNDENDYGDYKTVLDYALGKCEKLKDRFVIMDVVQRPSNSPSANQSRDDFRNYGIGMSDLKYGSAYFPYINSGMRYAFYDDGVLVNNGVKEFTTGADGLRVTFPVGTDVNIMPSVEIKNIHIKGIEDSNKLTIKGVSDSASIDIIINSLTSLQNFEAYKLNAGSTPVVEKSYPKVWGYMV